MEIKATLHITEMPLVIPFAASYGTYEKRESIVIELEDTDGHIDLVKSLPSLNRGIRKKQ